MTGRLFKITYVHKGPQGEAAHALMMHLDQNFTVRKTEVVDMTIANSTQGEEFNISTFCQKCQHDLDIPISILRFDRAIKTRGFYNQIFIHCSPPHALVTLIDSQRAVIRAAITDLNFDLSLEQSEFIPRMEAPERYLLLDSRKMPSDIFEALFLFDRRSKTVVEFYKKERNSLDTIAAQMEQEIGPIEKRGEVIEMLAMSRDEKEYVYIMFDYNVVIIGVDFNKTYIHWLKTLVQVLLLEIEMPNTLGLEIFLQLMERNLSSPKIHNVKTWSDILYSPLYSVNFIFKNERRINRVLRQLDKRFPNVAVLFRQCSEGKYSMLEMLNTETGLQNFDEFLELISYLEQKKLF